MSAWNCFRAVPIATLILSADAHSQMCPLGSVVFTVNGILTDAGGIQMMKDKLESAYLSAYGTDDSAPRFRVLYNPTARTYAGIPGGFTIDVLEYIVQLSGLSTASTIRMLAGLEAIPDSKKAIVEKALADAISVQSNLDPAVLNRMAGNVSAEIDKGNKVVLVGHSQGNLWANALLATMPSSQKTAAAQVGVAVPASRLEKSPHPHVTLTEDWVIRWLPVFTLPANVSNGYYPFEPLLHGLGHSYTNAYLEAGRPSRGLILSRVKDTLDSLQPRFTSKAAKASCASVQITGISCYAEGDFTRWNITGVASSPYPLSVVDAIPDSYIGVGTRVSSCDAWSGTANYSEYLYCARLANDPTVTNWRSTALSPSDGSVSFIAAEIFTVPQLDFTDFVNVPATFVAEDWVDAPSCPGTYTYPNRTSKSYNGPRPQLRRQLASPRVVNSRQ